MTMFVTMFVTMFISCWQIIVVTLMTIMLDTDNTLIILKTRTIVSHYINNVTL